MDKRFKVYNAIYGSDIFNQLPDKKVEKVNYNYYDDNYNDFKNYHNLQNYVNNNIKKKVVFQRNSSSPNFKTVHTQSFNNNKKNHFEKVLNNNNISKKENLTQNNCRKSKIDSLKSNIFNDKLKEKQNKKIDNSYKIGFNNNWNTNLDWRNAKSELVFYNNNHYPQYDNSSNNKINDLKKEKIKNFYKNKNIMNHQYKINNSNHIDMIKVKKDFENNGMHLFDVEFKSNFLNGHKDQSISFKFRENDPNEFRKKLNSYINNQDLNLINIKNYKVDINPKRYFQGNQKDCHYIKESKIKK